MKEALVSLSADQREELCAINAVLDEELHDPSPGLVIE